MDLAFSPDFYYHQNATFCTLLMAKLEFRQKRYPNLKCSSENGCFETETGAEIGEISLNCTMIVQLFSTTNSAAKLNQDSGTFVTVP